MSGANTPTLRDELLPKIKDALRSLVELHVTTVVGAATVSNANNINATTTVTLTGGDQKLANTVINTVLGDSTTIYTAEFQADAALLAAHKDAIAAAHTVRQETLDLLRKLLDSFKDILDDKPKTP